MKNLFIWNRAPQLSFALLLGCVVLLFGSLSYAGTQKVRMAQADTEWEGQIGTKKGDKLTVFTESEIVLEMGMEGNLDKHFEKNMFGGTIEGWIQIAKVRVEKVEPNKVTFHILEELSGGTINDEPIDHFKAGKRVKFVPGLEDE